MYAFYEKLVNDTIDRLEKLRDSWSKYLKIELKRDINKENEELSKLYKEHGLPFRLMDNGRWISTLSARVDSYNEAIRLLQRKEL